MAGDALVRAMLDEVDAEQAALAAVRELLVERAPPEVAGRKGGAL